MNYALINDDRLVCIHRHWLARRLHVFSEGREGNGELSIDKKGDKERANRNSFIIKFKCEHNSCWSLWIWYFWCWCLVSVWIIFCNCHDSVHRLDSEAQLHISMIVIWSLGIHITKSNLNAQISNIDASINHKHHISQCNFGKSF